MRAEPLHSGTIPVSGLQYTTSPSLPSAAKVLQFGHGTARTRGDGRHDTTASAVTVGRLASSTRELYDTYYASLTGPEWGRESGVDADPSTTQRHQRWEESLLLPDTLACIGPCARRLLQLDEAQRTRRETANVAGDDGRLGASLPLTLRSSARHTQQEQRTYRDSSRGPRTPIVPIAAHTLPIFPNKGQITSARTAVRHKPSRLDISSARPAATSRRPNELTGAAASLYGTPAAAEVRPPPLSSTVMNTTLLNKDAPPTVYDDTVPPVATQLRAFIQRELQEQGDGAVAQTAMEQLGPYREAFRALCSAFPGYRGLLSDIQSAYDNVIQAQAELLSESYAGASTREVEQRSHQEQAATMHDQVNALEVELKKMVVQLEARTAAAAATAATAEATPPDPATTTEDAEGVINSRPPTRGAAAVDALELRRDLEMAQMRVSELEESSRADLEKIMILIGAVRVCDRRLKDYEILVTGVSGQVSELDEFKRIAGDSQAELQQFRRRYADYVPIADFQSMKEHLVAELQAAQLLSRRWRRTAAVRGTQLDVMQTRLSVLEQDRGELLQAAAGQAGERGRTVLTPRPSWKDLYQELPELGDFAGDAGYLTTADDSKMEAATKDTSRRAQAAAAAEEAATGPPPLVTGPRETSLQVKYLVQRVNALEDRLAMELQRQNQQQQPLLSPRGEMDVVPLSVAEPSSPSPVPPTSTEEAVEAPVKLAAAVPAATPSRVRMPASRPGAAVGHSRLARLQQAGGAGMILSCVIPPMARQLKIPLIGRGYGADVPPLLRATGVLVRRPVAPTTIVSLVFHFFLDVLPPFLDQQDQPRREEEDALHGGRDRLATCLFRFLESEMITREDLKGYKSVPHLFVNLVRDAERPVWYTDALHLLLWTMDGLLPPRIGVDAAVVVAQVRRDLRALARELQSTRIRRQALSECLQPVLELKSDAEVTELRAALVSETSFSVESLCSDGHPVMQVLLVQECRAGMALYVAFLTALTTHSIEAPAQASLSSAGTPLPRGEMVLTLQGIAAAVLSVEPKTPGIVVRELSLNAVTAAGREGSGAAALDDDEDSGKAPVVVRLSDVVRAIGAAPLIRRTIQQTPENCTL